jgi:fatty-acid desaturase
MWFGWAGSLFGWQDHLVLVICYVVIGTGLTVGFHHLLTHRSFSATGWCRPAWNVVRMDPCRRPCNATQRPRSPQPSVVE